MRDGPGIIFRKVGNYAVGQCHVNAALRAELGFDPLYYCPCERGLRDTDFRQLPC